MSEAVSNVEKSERQIVYWRLLTAAFEMDDLAPNFGRITAEIAERLELPMALLETKTSIDTLIHRHPELEPKFDRLKEMAKPPVEVLAEDGVDAAEATEGEGNGDESEDDAKNVSLPAQITVAASDPLVDEAQKDEASLSQALVFSKLLLNVFGPNTRTPNCTAQQYQQWKQDVARFEASFGFGVGALSGGAGGVMAGGQYGAGVSGQGPQITDAQLREELLAMENDLIQRMDLRETLEDDRLAAQIPATLPILEQLLHDKSNLTGNALANARKLIRKYVDELAEVLKKQVLQSSSGEVDRSVPPKRVFRNLDMKRTLWQNLPRYNPEDGKLYVDRLHYRHASKKTLMNYFIVVVDQSGSMVDAMVQCAILASIFATLPNIQVSLIAFDTNVINLTPWVQDPFEALMRTNLGGGNDGPKAMEEARPLIVDPRKTTMVWISDFYERRELFDMIKSVRESGVHFIPVGSVSGTGYFSVDEWYRKRLAQLGCPVLTGNIRKLIVEMKKQLH